MKILLTNDDGYQAEGIWALQEALKPLGDIYMVAPLTEQSGTGHCMTVHDPLRVKQLSETVFAVNGYPTDCVKIALENILPWRPDLVVSGINHGANLGTDILYSGTASAALEGFINGIPSLAVSLVSGTEFGYAAQFTTSFCQKWSKRQFLPHIMFNINVPAGAQKDIKGYRFTEQGVRLYENAFEKRTDPRGGSYYWLCGTPKPLLNSENSDITAVQEQYVSITPIQFNLTNRDILNFLQKTQSTS